MDNTNNNNWRPAQANGAGVVAVSIASGDPNNNNNNNMVDGADWRSQLQPDSRQRIVNKIMDTLKRHLPISGPDGLVELKKIAVRFEEKIYTAATSQSDYLRKISLKMLTMETKSQNTGVANSIPQNSVASNQNPPDPASHSMQSQGLNQGHSSISLTNQSQARQQLLSQNIQNTSVSGGIQNSGGLQSAFPSVTGLNPSTMPNAIGQSSNLQNISGISQNTVGQSVPTNIFSNTQRQMQGRQHPQQVASQPNQQQSTNSQQYMYQQRNQILNQKLQQGNIQPSLMQSHIQQQQNLLQSTQLQPSQQSLMQISSTLQGNQSTQQTQPSMMQPASHAGFQQNQQPSIQQSTASVLQQHPQSVLRQQTQSQQSLHQQSTGLHQQPSSIPQQQQTLAGQQQNTTNVQQQKNQLIGQQNSVTDLQQSQQQQQRLLGQQNNLSNMQQQQQQQQLLGQQNNISNMNHQQIGSQNGVGLQQQQLLGAQSGASNMQSHQQSMHLLSQQAKVGGQQQQSTQASLMQIPGQQSQSQPLQQQLMPQLQSQPAQFQQQLGLQHQPNQLMQQRLNSSGIQPSNVTEQKQLQSQRALPEASSTSMDSTSQSGQANTADWQEEAYQKIKAMKDMYLPDLLEMHQKLSLKFQQHETVSQQPKEQIDKLKLMKIYLERIITFLQVTKSNIPLTHRDKLPGYEKQIINFLNSNRTKKPVIPNQQQLQPSGGHTLSMPQQQQPQSQVPQMQQHDNQMNSQMQPMNITNAVASEQPTAGTNMSHGSLPLSNHVGVPPMQGMHPMQSGSAVEMGQGSVPNSLQHGGMGSRQQNSVNTPSQANMNTLSQGGGLQPNINSLQLNSNMLQQQHMKQQQEQHLLQSQQIKQQQQLHQRQVHQQMMQQQKQHLQQQHPQMQPQQQQQQQKQQLPAQLQAHQMPHLHQMSEDLKMRQAMGFKQGMAPQHHSAGQRTPYHHQQLKPGAQFPISSPQILSAASPQISQHSHSSPQIDQQSLLTSFSKSGTPLQSANSPFIVPSPSTSLAPSPLPGDPEKQASGVSSLSNAGNIGHPQTSTALTQAQSIAIGTPGISASPLLAEFISTDSNQGTEQPLERLVKAVKSISTKAFTASVSDIGSVISMIDRIAGSAPGNGSRAAVGEDLVAMTKCRMQARNVITQDGVSATKKMRRDTSAMPLNGFSSAGSVTDSFKQLNGLEMSDLESTATSRIKRPRIEANPALLEEIIEINLRLIDTVVEISDEDIDPVTVAAAAEGGQGTVVKCSYAAVALSPSLKAQYASGQMSPIMPLQLLIPTNYPNCSPVLLDKFPVDLSKEYDDLSLKTRSRFSISLRSLSQPMSLKEMAKAWDFCARAVIAEYAQKSGGGTFSSRYGTWKKCVSAA